MSLLSECRDLSQADERARTDTYDIGDRSVLLAVPLVTADADASSRSIRFDLEPWHNGTALVQAVAKVNPNTVVIVRPLTSSTDVP